MIGDAKHFVLPVTTAAAPYADVGHPTSNQRGRDWPVPQCVAPEACAPQPATKSVDLAEGDRRQNGGEGTTMVAASRVGARPALFAQGE